MMCIIHDWGSWQKPKNTADGGYNSYCYQLRKCARCGKVGQRQVMSQRHDFTPDEDL